MVIYIRFLSLPCIIWEGEMSKFKGLRAEWSNVRDWRVVVELKREIKREPKREENKVSL